VRDSAFTNRIFYRFFIPTVSASVCLAFANLADALCVGMLLGEPALAAIGLVSPIYMVFNVLDLGLAQGGAVVFARRMGEGHVKQALQGFHQMFTAALLVSAGVGVLGVAFHRPLLELLGASPEQGAVYGMTRTYALPLLAAAPLFFLNFLFYQLLRCDDGEKRAGLGLTVSNLLDVSLSVVLVLGFRMGVLGAILATILGTAAGVLIYLPHFFKKYNILTLKLVRPDVREVFQAFRIGFASSSQYLFQFVFFLVLNNLLIRLHGESALAVFNVTLNLSYLVVGLFDGIGGTVQPLAATFRAERSRQAEKDTMRLALLWGGLLGGALLAGAALFAPAIARLFGLSREALGMGTLALRCYCAGGPGLGVSLLLGAYWQAVGEENRTTVLTFLRSFAVYLLLALPLAFGPLERFWLVFPATEYVSLGVLLLGLSLAGRRKGLLLSDLDGVPVYHQLLQGDTAQLSALIEGCEAFCEDQGASPRQTYMVTMVVEEMCQTIFAHGQDKKQQDVYIQITLFQSQPGVFDLHIRDNAPAFDPFSLKTRRLARGEDLDGDDDIMDSMGILMVKKKARETYYRHFQGFNTLLVRI